MTINFTNFLSSNFSPVTAMSWISTFRGVVTVDATNKLRTFKLENLEILPEEILSASSEISIETEQQIPTPAIFSTKLPSPTLTPRTVMSLQNYSPKQSLKFYGSRDPRIVSAWPDNAILKIESIPHQFTAFSIKNCGKQPTLTVHCLDYVSLNWSRTCRTAAQWTKYVPHSRYSAEISTFYVHHIGNCIFLWNKDYFRKFDCWYYLVDFEMGTL